MKKAIKWIVFLLVFTLLATGVTYVCIQRTLGERLLTPKIDLPYAEQPLEAGIDLMGTYDENHLVLTDMAEEYQGATVYYPKVEGLKDTRVQELVNLTIADTMQSLKDFYDAQGVHMAYLSYQVYGNFSNVLSIAMFSGSEEGVFKRECLNFNLNDGSLVTLQDVFCVQADVQGIVHGAFYDALTTSNLEGYYWQRVNSPDEHELYKIVRSYLAQEQPSFALAPDGIYLYWGDYMATVDMLDHAGDIAVYSKFLSQESLFLRDDIGYKDIFTCAIMPGAFEQRSFGFGGDNFWYDISLVETYFDESFPEEVNEGVARYRQGVYDSLMAEVSALQRLAAEHPEKAYILLAEPTTYLYEDLVYVGDSWQGIPSKAVVVNENYVLYETSRELFDSKYLNALIAEYRRNPHYLFYEGIDQYLDGDEVDYIKRNEDRLVMYETGAELTTNGLFVDGYDHGAAIRAQAKYELAGYYGFTMEDAELAVQALWYELAGGGLRVHIPAWGGGQHLWMPLNQFPKEALTIFQ